MRKALGREVRRRREFMALGEHSETEWMLQIERQMGLCFYCNGPLRDVNGIWRGTRDHKTPLAQGGTDNIDNIVAACWPCNRRKGNRTQGEYRIYLDQKEAEISELSEVPTYKSFDFFTIEMLNPSLQEPFRRFAVKAEAAALVFKGIDPTARKQAQKQKTEVARRWKA